MMKSKMIPVALKILVLSCMMAAIAHPLFAEDFTVTVPIELKNLPPTVTKGFLQAVAEGSSYSIGGADFWFDIVGGNYSNTVVLKFNANAGRDPNQVTVISAAIWIREETAGIFKRPSILLYDGGPFPGIDMTQPFREISIIPIVKP